MNEPRTQWVAALCAVPRSDLFELAHRLAQRHTVRPAANPEEGLALLPLRDSVHRQAFFLGEIPLSSSVVELISEDGRSVGGGAVVMADDADLANALAVCDGVLAHQLPGWEGVDCLLQQGLESLRDRARIRKSMTERTRVNFALLNEDGAPCP